MEPSDSDDPRKYVGTVLHGYRLTQFLGAGAVGAVFLAEHPSHCGPVAIKLLAQHPYGLPAAQRTPGMRERHFAHILAAAQTLTSVRHPHLLEIYQTGREDTLAYIAMQYVAGRTLYDLQADLGGVFPWRPALLAVGRVASALQAMHVAGLVHGDVKPSNILLADDGRVLLSDFDLTATEAELCGPDAARGAGTPGFMAPEQCRGEKQDRRSDIYSLGSTLYYLVTGQSPYQGQILDILRQTAAGADPKPPHALNADVPREVSLLIAAAMAMAPQSRFPTADAVRWAVRMALKATRSRATAAWDLQRLAQIPRTRREPAPGTWGTGTGFPASAGPARPESAPQPPASAPKTVLVELPAQTESTPESRPPAQATWLVSEELPLHEKSPPAEEPPVGDWTGCAGTLPPVGEPDSRCYIERDWLDVGARELPPVGKPATPEAPARPSTVAMGGEAREAAVGCDWVDCSVYAPPQIVPGGEIFVQVFLHLPDQEEATRQLAEEFDAEATRRARKSLAVEIPEQAMLNVHLAAPGLEVDEPLQTLLWLRRPEAVQFGVHAPPGRPAGTVVGTVTLSIEGVPVGHVKFKLSVAPPARDVAPPPAEVLGDEAQRYRLAFISYASADRKEVLKRVQMLRALRIRYFQDVLTLEPGERWQSTLQSYVGQCDLFLLFWSQAAQASQWVQREVRWALERQSGDALQPPQIFPVILEGPPPPAPPPELAHLHFNDYLTYFLQPDG